MNRGGVIRAIDKDILMQEIATHVVEGRDERYQFTWPDKRQAILAANAPLSKTLRPAREESVNFDETENLYIEGDNLDVLKLLQETYLGKIKMIYIDPPYNTGSDFVYKDDFKQSAKEYIEASGQYDEEGNRLEKNIESNGRFHTDWLNMIYPRLKLARNLLSDDGVIFISIDDNEQANLKKVCDEIFGEGNFVSNILRRAKSGAGHDSKLLAVEYEYMLVYAKDIGQLEFVQKRINVENDPKYRYEDAHVKRRGKYYLRDLQYGGSKNTPSDWSVKLPDGTEMRSDAHGKSGHEWRWSKQKFEWGLKNDFIVFKKSDDKWKVYIKQYQFVDNNDELRIRTVPYNSHFTEDLNSLGTTEISTLFNRKIFSYPKPSNLIKRILQFASQDDSIILDFFSGSATTAHAVMDLNAEDGGNRKYILVQLPEETDEKSEAYKAGYKTICDIGKERIRRAGQKILEDNGDKDGIENLDIGFRVLKVDSSNMKDVYYEPDMTEQGFLDSFENNIKEDRFPEDLLFQVMLDLGIPLSADIQVETVGGKDVYVVEGGFFIACFDAHVGDEVVKAIAEKKPYYAVFRDASMASDSVATNFDQIFESISPETVRKVL